MFLKNNIFKKIKMQKFEDKLTVELKTPSSGNLSTWMFGVYNKKTVGLYFTILIHISSTVLACVSMYVILF